VPDFSLAPAYLVYRPGAMHGLELLAFADEHLDAAAEPAELLAERHRAHLSAEPLLPAEPDFRAEIEALLEKEDASGAVALRDGDVVAYLVGTRLSDQVWGANVWVELAGHAAASAEDVRDLYGFLAARWVDEGRTRHFALVPATDTALVDAWFRLSFGAQHAYGIREVPAEVEPAPNVRLAREEDLEQLVALSPALGEHQLLAPVFSGRGPVTDPDALREEIVEDLRSTELVTLVAESNGRIVGNFVAAPVEITAMHSGLARPERAAFLGYAVTLPEVRGSGAGVALTNAVFAWARDEGYPTIVTDWRVTNLLSSRFWPRRGFRPTFLRLHRAIA
jgi:GNAT superfamily N-acetyltransferase